MSIITTVYTERLTITTDDNGNVTMQRTHHADTHSAFYFTELGKEAQDRAISEAIEEETDPANWYTSQTYFAESEIWQCAEDLTKQQPIRIYQDYGCSYCGEARARRWGASWEEVTEATNNGWCYSMDMCDAWNRYAPRIIALQEAHEEAHEQAEKFWSVFSEAQWKKCDASTETGSEKYLSLEAIEDTATEAATAFEDIANRIEAAAEELTEEAARAVGDVVDSLVNAEHDYYSSPEFWRDWLKDGETRFTREGERI